jgi:hypothetical protein
MDTNFRIFLHKNSDNLHLKLSGDFDGSSAHQLIKAIKNHNGKTSNIYVHTSSLSSVHPFGLDVFKKNCTLYNLTHSLTFTGEHGNKLAPDGSHIL